MFLKYKIYLNFFTVNIITYKGHFIKFAIRVLFDSKVFVIIYFSIFKIKNFFIIYSQLTMSQISHSILRSYPSPHSKLTLSLVAWRLESLGN